jgi:hypothetical protein
MDVGSGWVVFENNGGSAITGTTADTSAGTAVFNNRALTGSAGEAGTLAGTVSFDGRSTAAGHACAVAQELSLIHI